MDYPPDLDGDTRNLLMQMAELGVPDFSDLTPEQARGLTLSAPPASQTEVASATDITLTTASGKVPVRVYQPNSTGTNPVVVYFHGGGWVLGDLDSHDETCRKLCAGSGACVVAVHYRLAPETRYSGAVDDCYAVTGYIAANATEFAVDAKRIAVAGDRRAARRAAAVALKLRDEDGPALCFQLLVYPVTDANFDTGSYQRNSEGYFLTRKGMQWFWDHYVPEQDQRQQAYAAPLQADNLANLPPALVFTAGFDPLCDEGQAYAKALQDAGNQVTHTHFPGLIHGFIGMQETVAAARPAMDQATAALHDALA